MSKFGKRLIKAAKEARAIARGEAKPGSSKLTEKEFREFRRLLLKVGGWREQDRLIACARREPPGKRGPKGPRYADDHVLLVAAALQRHNGLERGQALRRVANIFWTKPTKASTIRGPSKEQFIKRLRDRLEGRSLAEFADAQLLEVEYREQPNEPFEKHRLTFRYRRR